MEKDILLINQLWKDYIMEQFKYGPNRLKYMLNFSEQTKYFFTHLKILNFYVEPLRSVQGVENKNLFNFRFEYFRFRNYIIQDTVSNEGMANSNNTSHSILPEQVTEEEKPYLYELFNNFVSTKLTREKQL